MIALQKSVDSGYGVDATYHVVVNYNINKNNMTSRVIVSSYYNKIAHDNNNLPLKTFTFTWNGDDFPFTDAALSNSTLDDIAYAKILTDQNWLDAIAVN